MPSTKRSPKMPTRTTFRTRGGMSAAVLRVLISPWMLFAIALLPWARTAAADPIPLSKARDLATNICSQCHLFTEPNLLDKTTWRDQVKPLMRKTMGLAAIENDPSPNSRVLMREWDAIWEYYLIAAPEKMPPQDPRPPILPDLTLFRVEDPHYGVTNSFASLIHIDSEAHQVYVGNAITKSIDVLDSKGHLLSSTPVDSTLVHLLKRPDGWIGTQIGFVPPNDMPLGRITL